MEIEVNITLRATLPKGATLTDYPTFKIGEKEYGFQAIVEENDDGVYRDLSYDEGESLGISYEIIERSTRAI